MSKKKTVILVSVLSAILIAALVFAATRPVTVVVHFPESYYTQQVPSAERTAADTSAPAETTVAPAPETTAAPTEQTTQAEQTAAEQTTAAPVSQPEQTTAVPVSQPEQTTAAPQTGAMSKDQIVALYNTAVNKVKREAATLTRNYKHVSAPEDQLELPGAIQGIGKTAIGTFVKGTDTPETWTEKADMQIVFPVGNTDYSSHLTADMVETAACEDTGSAYKITLKLYDDKLTSPEKGQGYAGVFNTTTASTFTEINIPTVTFNRVDINGVNGSITCTIDKATQRVTEITFANTDILKLEVKVVVATLNVKLALAVEENYSIAY